MSSTLRLEDVRDGILEAEGQKGYRLAQLGSGAEPQVEPGTPAFDVLRAMVRGWRADGGPGVAALLARAGRGDEDAHLWATASELPKYLAPGDPDRKALEDIIRNRRAILAGRGEIVRRAEQEQTTLDFNRGGA